jgi:phosphatidate phosphatase APP1
MAAAYQAIDADTFEGGNDNGTRFHYLSGSPHPLQPALAGFLRAEGFPEGSLHLREVQVIEDLFGETGTFAHKRAVLDALLAAAPARRFVLVGDSGERDPEIYGATARAWPGRILAIRIRDVTGESREAARYVEAFRDLPEDLWAVFRDPAALRDDAAWRAATAR